MALYDIDYIADIKMAEVTITSGNLAKISFETIQENSRTTGGDIAIIFSFDR